MEKFYDGLIIDERSRDNLFDKSRSTQPLYADVLKRWAVGNPLNAEEQRIHNNILASHPEYVFQYGKTKVTFQLTDNLLQIIESQHSDNPEKALTMYRLLYFLITVNAKEKWEPLIIELKNIICHYEATGVEIFEGLSSQNAFEKLYAKTFSDVSPKEKIAKVYFEIITRILDLKEMLLTEPWYDLNEFPLPRIPIDSYELALLRRAALDLYKDKNYDAAIHIYNLLRIARFELSGTFIHLVRVQLRIGNIDLSEMYAALAWRYNGTKADYITCRILFTMVLLNMLLLKPFEIWLGCLKHLLLQKDNTSFVLEWEMEKIIAQYEALLKVRQAILLRRILAVISYGYNFEKLKNLSLWKKSEPIPLEQWPEYSVTINYG